MSDPAIFYTLPILIDNVLQLGCNKYYYPEPDSYPQIQSSLQLRLPDYQGDVAGLMSDVVSVSTCDADGYPSNPTGKHLQAFINHLWQREMPHIVDPYKCIRDWNSLSEGGQFTRYWPKRYYVLITLTENRPIIIRRYNAATGTNCGQSPSLGDNEYLFTPLMVWR
jgi:hypothetical protein